MIVPVESVATQRLPMAPALGFLLAGLGLFLFAGAVALVSAAVRESTLPAGADPSPAQRRQGWIAAAVAAAALGLVLYAGRQWWNTEDRNYRMNEIYRPLPLAASLRREGGEAVIHLDITRPARGRTSCSSA